MIEAVGVQGAEVAPASGLPLTGDTALRSSAVVDDLSTQGGDRLEDVICCLAHAIAVPEPD